MGLLNTKSNILNSAERTGAIVVAILLILRIIFGTAMNLYLQTGFTLMAVFYLWSGFFIFTNTRLTDLSDKKRRSEITPVCAILGISLGIIYSISMISMIHAVNFYPGMQTILSLSLLLLILSIIMLIVYYRYKPGRWKQSGWLFLRSVIMGAIVSFLLLTPVDKRLNILYRKHPGFLEAYKEYQQNPESDECLDRLRFERSKFR